MAEYRGVSGVARQIAKEYRGVSGVARQIIKAYRGVSGVARMYFNKNKYKIEMYVESKSEDTDISSYSITGAEGILDISLITEKGGDTSQTYNGCAAGIKITIDDELQKKDLSFTLDITGGSNYLSVATIGFYNDSGNLIESYDMKSNCSKSYEIPIGTTFMFVNLWCRYKQNCTARFTNFKIDGQLVDLSI